MTVARTTTHIGFLVLALAGVGMTSALAQSYGAPRAYAQDGRDYRGYGHVVEGDDDSDLLPPPGPAAVTRPDDPRLVQPQTAAPAPVSPYASRDPGYDRVPPPPSYDRPPLERTAPGPAPAGYATAPAMPASTDPYVLDEARRAALAGQGGAPIAGPSGAPGSPQAGPAEGSLALRPPVDLGGSASPVSVDPRARGAGVPQPGGGPTSLLPPEDQPETGPIKELPPHLKRQEVAFATKEPAGTIVVDTANTHLYYILGNGRAIRYGIRVGRDGFRWSGTQTVTRKNEWPDWHPPAEMIERQPYLPRFMAGGPGNPMGARALYLGSTVYRIHGTNQPSTIGQKVSSGCFGLLNEDVEDLYGRVNVGARVVVLPSAVKPVASPHVTPAPPAKRDVTGSITPRPPQAVVAPSRQPALGKAPQTQKPSASDSRAGKPTATVAKPAGRGVKAAVSSPVNSVKPKATLVSGKVAVVGSESAPPRPPIAMAR